MTEPAGTKFVLECPKCDARFNLKKYVPDRKVRCRRCRAIVKIPIVDQYLTPEERTRFAAAQAKPLDPEMRDKLTKAFSLRRLAAMTLSMVVLLAGGIGVFWMKARRPATPPVVKKDGRRITWAWLSEHNKSFDYPMGPGFEWAYAIGKADDPGGPRQEERRVLAQSGGPEDAPQFELGVGHPSGSYRQSLRIETDGVFLLGEQRGTERFTFDPPMPLLRFPLVGGDVWAYAGKYAKEGGGTEAWDVAFRVTTEVVESGIGRRECFRVETRGTRGVATIDDVAWYAPGVGVVKRRTKCDGRVEEATLVRYKQ